MRALFFITMMTMIISCGQKNTPADGSSEEVSSSADAAVKMDGQPMLIGTYTRKEGHVDGKAEGLHLAYLKDGKINYVKNVPAGINPSYLALHPGKPFVYVANEIGSGEGESTGAVTALAYDEDYNFTELNNRPTQGAHSCHISVSNYGSHVMTANYSGGDIAAYPLTLDGKTGNSGYNNLKFSGSGPHPNQQSPHLHFIAEGPGGLIYTADLGTDSVRVFSMTNGVFTKHPHQIVVASGAGPRHMTFHPSMEMIYIVNELNGTVEVWKYSEGKPYQRMQTITTLEAGATGFAHCGAIKISADGQHLYASNRADQNNIVVYDVSAEGLLSVKQHVSTMGKIPRDFAISPDGKTLVIANQDSDNMVTYTIDPVSGMLSNPIETKNIASPVCVVFL